MPSDIVSFDRVAKRYGKVMALDDVSLTVGAGEMFGVIGPDGAGKTTTIRILCGLLGADAGTVRVFGLDPKRDHRRITGSIGYLSQRFSLYGDLSVDENIAFFAEIHGLSDYHAIRDRVLSLTGLAPFHGRLAAQLSGGMKQKLALACTLVHEPRLIVLDEPTTGVDPISRREFWKLLAEFRAQGITIIMSTPYLDEAERCSRVALLHLGRVMALDTPGALRATLSGTFFEVMAPDHRRAASVLKEAPGALSVQMFGERLHIRLAAGSADGAPLLAERLHRAGLEFSTIRPVSPSLEDVFVGKIAEAPS